MKTGKRKIFERICAVIRNWDNMVNREFDKLPTLVGVAKFAQKSGAFSRFSAKKFGDFTRQD